MNTLSKALLVLMVLMGNASQSHAIYSTLECEAISNESDKLILRVKNKFMKRIDAGMAAKEAPVLYFERYNDDKKFMVYETDSKNGYQVALPVREWEPKDEYGLDIELYAYERAIIDHRPASHYRKLKCVTILTLTREI